MSRHHQVTLFLVLAQVVWVTGTALAEDSAAGQGASAAPGVVSEQHSGVASTTAVDAANASTWYGGQTLTADGAAVGLVALGIAVGDEGGYLMTIAGIVTYFVGAPIIHEAHDRSGAAFASVGVRIVAPSLGLVLGASSDDCNDYEGPEAGDCGHGLAVGLLLGIGTAMAVDAIVLAHDDAQKPRKPAARRLQLAPAVSVTRERSELVVTGTF